MVAVVGSNWFDGLCVCVALLMVCVCVCVALLMVCACVCVCGSVCVVMGMDRLIGVSWVCVCVALCVELVLKVEGEREEKKYCWKAQENRIMPKSEKK